MPTRRTAMLCAASTLRLSLAISSLLITACSGQPEYTEILAPAAEYAANLGVSDDRGRFRETFCAVLEQRGESLPDYRPCEQALTREGEEAGATGAPVLLGQSNTDYLMLIVPGLGWACVEGWLKYDSSGQTHLAQFGYDIRKLAVDSLSSTENNARQIRDYIAALPEEDARRPIILMGYSKGAPDILSALVDYPELQPRVVAVVALAGSVAGSPLANDASQGQANLLTLVPGSECDKGDGGAVNSLKTAVRQQWLSENTLPGGIEYFSIVTYPNQDRISRGLKQSYRKLAKIDPRNDTQVLIYDQLIPGSTLLAYVNADHWALAVPIAKHHKFVGGMVINHNDYPREALLEALARYLEETLQP